MSKVLYFDYAAFCVFTLIMVSVIMKKMTRGKLNRQFQFVLTIAMVATAFDIGLSLIHICLFPRRYLLDFSMSLQCLSEI